MRSLSDFAESLWALFKGVLKRWFAWGPFLLLDVSDVYNRYIADHLPVHARPYLDMIPTILPYIVGAAVILSIGAVYHELRMRLPKCNVPDTKIKDAIDYIVNDSTAIIPPAPQPEVRHDQIRSIIGWEHEEARKLLTEAASEDRLTLFGYKEIPNISGYAYSDTKKPIPSEYWQNAELSYASYMDAVMVAQTQIAYNIAAPNYTGLHVCKRQIEQLWPPLSQWRRLSRFCSGYRRKVYPPRRGPQA